MKVTARIVQSSTGAAFLVTLDACGRCFDDPRHVQDRIGRDMIYQHPKTRTIHSIGRPWRPQQTVCGLPIPKDHRADVSVVVR